MEGKITLSLFYMGLVSAVVAVALSVVTFYGTIQEQVRRDLQASGDMVAVACERGFLDPEGLAAFGTEELRITLIAADGTVLMDSNAPAGEMEDHSQRPEIEDALSLGFGWAARQSQTLGTNEYYYAQRLDSGDILRVSVEAATVPMMLGQAAPGLIGILILLFVLAVVFAVLLTKRLLQPIRTLPAQLDDPDLANDTSRVYPELAPFVREIQNQRSLREEMRQEFTATVSHELKTPLTTISGYAEMIETGLAKPEDNKKIAGVIHREAGRLLQLIGEIIRLSELDASGRQEVRQDRVELLGLAKECRETLESAAAQRGIRLEVEGSPWALWGNRTQLWELVYNLMDNAIRYNRDNGTVTVEVGKGFLAVRDTGIGIPKEHQGRIFERFYRVDKSHSRATGGTGLGLSIVKHVAEAHRGRITVESTVNVGTEIRVTFAE